MTTYVAKPVEYWKTRDGQRVAIADMKTTHLFYVLRMFWNHSCPEHLQIRPFKRYRIRMTRKHALRKIRAITIELQQRDDLPDDLAEQLAFMVRNRTGG